MPTRVHYEDLILDLYIFDRIEKGGGRKKIAKLLFLLEDDLFDQDIVGPHYVMQKYPYGPYNTRVKTNLDNLTKNGYLRFSNRYYPNQITSKFIKEIDDLIQENSIIFDQLDEILESFGSESGDNLADFIKSLEQIGMKNQPFHKYNEFEVIVDPRRIQSPKYKFYLDDAWYDTLEILLNPKMFANLQSAIRDCQLGNFTLY